MTGVRQSDRTAGPGIAELALDATAMVRRLAPLLTAELGIGAEHVAVTDVRVLGGRPGDRTVVAYELDTRTAGRRTVIGKVFAQPERARRLYELLVSLERADVCVPRPIGCLDDLGMVCYWAARGEPLAAASPAERPALVAAAARWLASLHAVRVPLDRQLNLAVETRNVALWGELVVAEYPGLADRVRALVERVELLASSISLRSDVTMHKDFQYQHTLFDAGTVTVIDLDEMRAGDPAFDVGHFAAYLRLLAVRGATAGPDVLEQAFLDAYRSAAAYELDARHEYAHAYSCVKIAKQLATGRGPGPIPSGDERTRQIAHLLAEGLRCPNR